MIIYYKHTKRSDIIEHRFLCKNISQIRRKNYNDYTCTTKNLDIKPTRTRASGTTLIVKNDQLIRWSLFSKYTHVWSSSVVMVPSVVPLSFIICKALLLNCTWLCTMYLIWVNETVWIEETSTITIYIGRHKIFADLFFYLYYCVAHVCVFVCMYVCMLCFDELLNHNIMSWFYVYHDNIKR